MRSAFRYAWWLLAGSLTCVGIGVFFMATPYWPLVVFFLYGSILLLWRGWDERNRHRRRRAEDEWWRKRKLGIRQPPMKPCCVRFGRTGPLHDDLRCTRERAEESWIQQGVVDMIWEDMIADLGDLEQ